MSYNDLAAQDFERARSKAFWRKALAWLFGETNELLPFDEVRERVQIRGQHYIGLRQVPIDQILGSAGRFRDFDRTFLPLQTRTRDRWLNIDRAHYAQVNLPPVELYKIGEIYFVKDGNHRVSVARERGQLEIDAFVVEIEIPIPLTAQTKLDDLQVQQERVTFLEQTQIDKLRPEAKLESKMAGQYPQLLEHIAVHRWYLGEQRGSEVSYGEAVESWYDHIYLPFVEAFRKQDILADFQGLSETDLYLWIMKYEALLREAFKGEQAVEQPPEPGVETAVKEEATRQLSKDARTPPIRNLADLLRRAEWVDELILTQERASFLRRTRLIEFYPDARFETSLPGRFQTLLEHINAHRWYLGEKRGAEVPYEEAVRSWYENVYQPLIMIIREQGVLENMPERTETDMYLWIISRQWILREMYGAEVPAERAAQNLADEYAQKKSGKRGKTRKQGGGEGER